MPDMQYPGPGHPVRLVDSSGAAIESGNPLAVDAVLNAEGLEVTVDNTDLITAVDAGTTATGAVQTAVEDVELSVDEAKTDIVAAVQDVELSVDENKAEVIRVGTRTYGTIERVAVASTSAQSAAITGTEVLMHASTKCYVLSGSSPTAAATTSIPLEAGEKFHMRITSGHKIAVIRDAADGYLHIATVA